MPVPLTPLRCLTRAVDLFCSRIGIICGERQFTYGEFAARCGQLATALTRAGLQPGDRAAFLSFNNHQLLEGYYGVVQAGGIVMPLNVRLSPQELAAILNHSGARFLFFESDFLALVDGFKTICPELKRYIELNGAYEDLLSTGEPVLPDIMKVDDTQVAELFYTSGSTGTPKGVMLTHRNLYEAAMSCAAIAVHPDTVDLHTIPLFHANGWTRPQSSTLLGYKQVMVRRFDPVTVFGLIQRHRATEMSLVPTMANFLLNCPDRAQYDLSSLRTIMIGGAASSPELIQRLESAFGCEAFAGYGLTETSPILTIGRLLPGMENLPEAEKYRRKAMAGWPVPGVEVRVVDLYDKPVAKDGKSVGEVVGRGDNIMLGYYKDQAATDAVIVDGWFHTGDMAVWDETGYIHIVDRKKEIIISGGENISSLEVERAIFSHADVFECAVVAAPDEYWGEVPAALVVLKPGAALTADALRTYLEGILGKFKMPRIIEFTSDPLPKTGTGKIRKMIIRERFWAGREKRVQG